MTERSDLEGANEVEQLAGGEDARRPARRTKIVCTLGPATSEPEVLTQLILAGMDVARFNLSHGSHDEHAVRLTALREAEKAAGREVAVMFDLRGPEVRLLLPGGGPLRVNAGDRLPLPESTWPGLAGALQAGERVLLADGTVTAEVVQPAGHASGGSSVPLLGFTSAGVLRDRSKVVIPGLRPDLPAVSEQDEEDVRFGVKAGADIFAMSFVHEARDILELKDLLLSLGSDATVIAKVETRASFDDLQAILAVADGAMVARGDLGVQCPFDQVPRMQKEILALCGRLGKPGITATEMLESMTRLPRPTRAEASDVFNAVLDGTDALMLSGETAIGAHPLEACQAMASIAVQAETMIADGRRSPAWPDHLRGGRDDAQPPSVPAVAIAGAAVSAAEAVGASALVTPTRSGYTARMVARLRPRQPIVAVSSQPRTVRVLNLTWGVTPVLDLESDRSGDPVESALGTAVAAGLISPGDLVAVTSGIPSGVPGTTNMFQLRTIGEITARGTGIVSGELVEKGGAVVTGPLCVAADLSEVAERYSPGCILAVQETNAALVPYMRGAGAVLTGEGGLSSHAAVVCLSLGVPVIVGVPQATSLPNGRIVTVDAARGLIYLGRVRPA